MVSPEVVRHLDLVFLIQLKGTLESVLTHWLLFLCN